MNPLNVQRPATTIRTNLFRIGGPRTTRYLREGVRVLDKEAAEIKIGRTNLGEEMISPRIYVIVPRTFTDGDGKNMTMTCGRMAAHVAHAISELTLRGVNAVSTDLITLQVHNSSELYEIQDRLIKSSVDFYAYKDEDHSFKGEVLTALALFPIERGSCEAIRSLGSWRCACNI